MSGLKTGKRLLIAIGNTNRRDDALGWSLAALMEQQCDGWFDIEYRHQLQIEDAELVSRYEEVVFADATGEVLEQGFAWKDCRPAAHYFFSSHMQSPETVLYLAGELYNAYPRSAVLLIQGSDWQLSTGLSTEAAENLQRSAVFLLKKMAGPAVSTPLLQ
jgi:hydrogenase maturation protease